MRGGLSAIVALTASAALVIVSYPAVDLGWAAWIALVPWFSWLVGRGRKAAFLGSFVLFLVTSLCLLSWLAMLTPPGLGALVVYLGLFGGALGVLSRRMLASDTLLARLGVASLFAGVEWLRSVLFSGFPWLLVGHTQHDALPVAQIADLGGVYAITFVVVFVNASFLGVWNGLRGEEPQRRGSRILRAAGPAALLIVAVLGYGFFRMAAPPDTEGPRVAGIQANIPVALKHDAMSSREVLDRHVVLSERAVRESDPDLVIWAETMFPAPWNEASPGELEAVQGLIRELVTERMGGTPFLVGITAIGEGSDDDPQSPDYRQWNRAILFGGAGDVAGMYDKAHLVPGGEYFPMRSIIPFRRQLEKAFYELAGWYPTMLRGERSPRLELTTEQDSEPIPFGVMICYDSVFPDIARRATREGARFLVNLSNDGWYRRSAELDQILAITRFRAIECRRPICRVTNTGISAMIDSRGRILQEVTAVGADGVVDNREVEGVLTGSVGISESGSPYSQVGDGFAVLALALGSVLVLRSRRGEAAGGREEPTAG